MWEVKYTYVGYGYIYSLDQVSLNLPEPALGQLLIERCWAGGRLPVYVTLFKERQSIIPISTILAHLGIEEGMCTHTHTTGDQHVCV